MVWGSRANVVSHSDFDFTMDGNVTTMLIVLQQHVNSTFSRNYKFSLMVFTGYRFSLPIRKREYSLKNMKAKFKSDLCIDHFISG